MVWKTNPKVQNQTPITKKHDPNHTRTQHHTNPYFDEVPFNRLNHNILGEIRPRFKLMSNLEPEEILAGVNEHLQTDETVKGRVLKSYAIITVPPKEVHFWSPVLQIRIDDDEFNEYPDGTVVRCLVGPRQSVWAMFAFVYIFIGLATFFGGIYGLAMSNMGDYSNFIWVIPIGLVLMPSIWIAAKIGQKAGRDQTLHLVSTLYHSLDARGDVHRIE